MYRKCIMDKEKIAALMKNLPKVGFHSTQLCNVENIAINGLDYRKNKASTRDKNWYYCFDKSLFREMDPDEFSYLLRAYIYFASYNNGCKELPAGFALDEQNIERDLKHSPVIFVLSDYLEGGKDSAFSISPEHGIVEGLDGKLIKIYTNAWTFPIPAEAIKETIKMNNDEARDLGKRCKESIPFVTSNERIKKIDALGRAVWMRNNVSLLLADKTLDYLIQTYASR